MIGTLLQTNFTANYEVYCVVNRIAHAANTRS